MMVVTPSIETTLSFVWLGNLSQLFEMGADRFPDLIVGAHGSLLRRGTIGGVGQLAK